ncbi:lanthionine synthetase LanC family protein [candidate division KSB1 bacterium]
MKRFIFINYITFVFLVFFSCNSPQESKYLEFAEKTANWITSTAIETGNGLFWPSQPDTMRRGEISMYHGVPGGILFFLELYKVTKKDIYRVQAEKAAEWLINRAYEDKGGFYWGDYSRGGNTVPDPGLYTGTAGVGTVFLELYKHLGNNKYQRYAVGAANWLVESKNDVDSGSAWGQVTDIISGAAGTGFFLIRAWEELKDEKYILTAGEVGDFLINEAIEDSPGVKWSAFPNSSRIYPNFSHGTSGIACYLALLYEKTGEEKYLQASLAGAEWLENHEPDHSEEGHAWYHHEPDGIDLYYAGWCHGPAGTARLFYQLFKVTGDKKWMNSLKGSANWLMNCGIPEKKIDGFWNVSVCCGNAGIADFFADMYKLTGDNVYRDWALKMIENLINKADVGNNGIKWVQAENRTRPQEVYAQTGYSQGAAGIGLVLLKTDAFILNNKPFSVFVMPDNPFKFE